MDLDEMKAVVDKILELAPQAVGALATGLVEAGLVDDHIEAIVELEELFAGDDDYWTLGFDTDDERHALVRTFVDTGFTLTHRLTDAERDDNGLEIDPDLAILAADVLGELPLADRSGAVWVSMMEPGRALLMGPLGWLDDFVPGDLLALRRTGGTVEVYPVTTGDLEDDAAEVVGLHAALDVWLPPGGGAYAVPVLMEAVGSNPSLFREPVRPVGELFEAIGLERRGLEWGPAEEDWSTALGRIGQGDGDVDADDEPMSVGDRYGFEPCCQMAFARVTEVFVRFENDPADPDVDLDAIARELVDDLGHDRVTAAVVTYVGERLPSLVAFADAVANVATGRRRAPWLTLKAHALLQSDLSQWAYDTAVAAVAADADYEPAAGLLAELELDRGDLTAVKRLARVDQLSNDLLMWAEEEVNRRHATRASVGRNDPCPCGSGRKFKQCCAQRTDLSLMERRPMVLERLQRFAADPAFMDVVVVGMMTLLSEAVMSAGPDPRRMMEELADDPILMDLAIHEGGLADVYLLQRGELLADDERDLIETIVGAPRELWEVTAVEPGASLDLRNTRTGDEVTVAERSGTLGRSVGEFVFVRVAPIDDVHMMWGIPLSIPLASRDGVVALIDEGDNLDVDGLARWYGRSLRPPTMTTTDGDALALCRTILDPGIEAELVELTLDEFYERNDEDGEPVWTTYADLNLLGEPDKIEGMAGGVGRTVIATLRFDGSRIEVETLSQDRMDVVVDDLFELFEEMEFIEESVLDPFDALAARLASQDDDDDPWRDAADGDDVGGDSPELRAAMQAVAEQFAREHEKRWVDEPVPALGGLTPREALDDPTRREDLFAILRDMRDHERRTAPRGAPGATQSAERTAALLGIDLGEL